MNITEQLNNLYEEANALQGISLKDDPLRFDVAAPIVTEWTLLERERLNSITDKRDTQKFLQSVISVADIQVPYDRKDTKRIIDAGISFVSVLFARNSVGAPTIMLRAYIQTDSKFLNFERLTTVLTKTYCPTEMISWDQLDADSKTLGIKDELDMIIDEFHHAIHEVKTREELESKVQKTIVRLV